MNLLCRDESCSVYQMKNETGDGTATYYEVYPGIGVMYNDFHMEHCPSRKFEQNTHTFAIHHCREGRVEWEVSNGAYLYLASGDIMLDSSATENNHCSFPVSHYHGITITTVSYTHLDVYKRQEIESVVWPGVNNILPDNILSISVILSFVILISLFA